jgi:hypothetical protein
MKIQASLLPPSILDPLKNPDPLEGSDIVIEDEQGNVIGAIIQPDAYEFFLRKVEEREDELDSDPSLRVPYNPNAQTLEDLENECT